MHSYPIVLEREAVAAAVYTKAIEKWTFTITIPTGIIY